MARNAAADEATERSPKIAFMEVRPVGLGGYASLSFRVRGGDSRSVTRRLSGRSRRLWCGARDRCRALQEQLKLAVLALQGSQEAGHGDTQDDEPTQ